MPAAELRTVLLDVGGTLLPSVWPDNGRFARQREQRLRALHPNLSVQQLTALVAELNGPLTEVLQAGAHNLPMHVRAAYARVGLSLEPDVEAVREAMLVATPAPFAGAGELLATIRLLGLRSVIVSNTLWRDAAVYRQDFAAMGLLEDLDGIVTSLDAGYYKPHLAMFELALAAAGAPAQACVMVGDSEANDVEPAASLGMRAIRVDIERSGPDRTLADAVVTSLDEVAGLLQSWTASRT